VCVPSRRPLHAVTHGSRSYDVDGENSVTDATGTRDVLAGRPVEDVIKYGGR